MKNYLIGFLVVCLAVLGSFYYKGSKAPVLNGFPIVDKAEPNPGGEPSLYLFLFFSRNNCHVCMEAVQVLNKLPSQFVVAGIVPGEELKQEADFRKATGAEFKLIRFNKTYKKFNPYYTPTIFGVSGSGHVLFVLPGVPGQKNYLYDFLMNFYGKSIELLIPFPDDSRQGMVRHLCLSRFFLKECLKKGYSKKETHVLLKFIDWLIRLPDELDRQISIKIRKEEEDYKMAYVTSFERIAKKDQAVEIAKRMKQDGEPIDKIAKYSGLSIEEIEKLTTEEQKTAKKTH